MLVPPNPSEPGREFPRALVDPREVQYIAQGPEIAGPSAFGVEHYAVLVLRDGGARLVVDLSYERVKVAGLEAYLR